MRTMLSRWVFLAFLALLTACAKSYEYRLPSTPAAAPMAAMEAPPLDMETGEDMDGDYDAVLDADDKAIDREVSRSTVFTEDGRNDLAKSVPSRQQPAASGGAAPAPSASEAVAVRGPLLIYTAQVTMAVFEVTASLAKVEAIARDLGGFLAKRDDTTITVRVPVARFDEALKRIETAGDMLHRNVAVEDVTEEFTDLEIRLRNARAIRDRLEKLLEKASNVEESVLLERELGRVAGEIDRIEGRLKYLRDRAAFSTITVTFQARPRESIDPSGPRLPVGWLNELGLGRLLNL